MADQSAWTWLGDLTYEGVVDNMLNLRLGDDHADRAGFVRGRIETLARKLSEIAGRTVKVNIATPESISPARTKRGVTQEDLDNAMQMPLTRQVANLFNATPVDVRDKPGANETED